VSERYTNTGPRASGESVQVRRIRLFRTSAKIPETAGKDGWEKIKPATKNRGREKNTALGYLIILY
jgi:hypothetical protein